MLENSRGQRFLEYHIISNTKHELPSYCDSSRLNGAFWNSKKRETNTQKKGQTGSCVHNPLSPDRES